MHDRFVMISRWQLDCSIEHAWQLIADIRSWPQWWPEVISVQTDDVDAGDTTTPRIGSIAHIRWKTRLGYGLRLRTTTLRALPPLELEGAADGDLNGQGLWLLEPQVAGGVRITYRWDVRLSQRWMRICAPLLRPLFAWNHFTIMRSGARAMAQRIGCKLLNHEDLSVSPAHAGNDLRALHWPG